MARLPDIQYQRAQQSDTLSPAMEVQKSRDKIGLVNQAMQGAKDVTDTYAEYDLAKNAAAYSDEMSAFRKEAAKELAVGPEKIIAWGLDKELDMEGKTVFYKSEWYPLLLSKQMDATRDKYAGKIKSNVNRTKFINTVTEQNNKMLESEIEWAAKVTKEEHDAMVMADTEIALASGNYDTAMTLIDKSGLMPSQKKEAQLKVVEAKDNNEIHDILQVATAAAEKTGSVGGITALAEYLRTDEARQKYSVGDAQLDQWADRADALAKGIENDKKIGAEQTKAAQVAAVTAQMYADLNSPGGLNSIKTQQYIDYGVAVGNPTIVNSAIEWNRKWTENGGGQHAPKGKGDNGLYQALLLMDRDAIVAEDLTNPNTMLSLDPDQYAAVIARKKAATHAKESSPEATPEGTKSVALANSLGSVGFSSGMTEKADPTGERRSGKAAIAANFNALVIAEEAKLKRALNPQEVQVLADQAALPYIQERYTKKGTIWDSEETGDMVTQIMSSGEFDENPNAPAIIRNRLGQVVIELNADDVDGPVTTKAIMLRYQEVYGNK